MHFPTLSQCMYVLQTCRPLTSEELKEMQAQAANPDRPHDQQGRGRTDSDVLDEGGCLFQGEVRENGDHWHPRVEPKGLMTCISCKCKVCTVNYFFNYLYILLSSTGWSVSLCTQILPPADLQVPAEGQGILLSSLCRDQARGETSQEAAQAAQDPQDETSAQATTSRPWSLKQSHHTLSSLCVNVCKWASSSRTTSTKPRPKSRPKSRSSDKFESRHLHPKTD